MFRQLGGKEIKCSIADCKLIGLAQEMTDIHKCDVCGKRVCNECYFKNKSFHHVGKPTQIARARHCSKICADITTNK